MTSALDAVPCGGMGTPLKENGAGLEQTYRSTTLTQAAPIIQATDEAALPPPHVAFYGRQGSKPL